MSTSPGQVGWYGLGSMGIGMASNLQKYLQSSSNRNLLYSNRTLSKGDSLNALGATPCPDFRQLVQSCDIIFTMISNDAVLLDLLAIAIQSGDLAGKIFVDTSTVHPDTSSQVSAQLSAKGAQFVASPVFGASTVAAAGTLIFAQAGPAAAIATIKPLVLNVMGRSILSLGEDVKSSSLMKITGNILVISFMETISEAFVFAEKSGLGTGILESMIGDMFGPTLGGYCKRLSSGAFAPPLDVAPGFAVSLAIKDAKHAVSIAHGVDMRLPALETALGHMVTARHFAGENLDSSSMYGMIRAESGLSFFTRESRQE